MPQPNIRELVVAGPLQNVSIAYKNGSYIADKLAPIYENTPPKAKVARYLKGAWFRDEAGVRGPGGRARRGGYPVDYIDVAPIEFAFAKEVTDEDRRAVKVSGGPPLRPDEDALQFCADKIDLSKERRLAAAIFAGTWGGGTAGGSDLAGAWATGAGSTFLADVEDKIESIRQNTGLRPNVLMLSANTYANVKSTASVLDRIKYTERGVVTADLLASLFNLEEVVIGDAIKSTAKEKKDGTDFTTSNVWEKNAGKGAAFLFYRPSRVGLKVPMAMAQFREAYEDGRPRRVTTWREAPEHQDVYEVAESTDLVVTGADLGYLWIDTILT